MGFFESSTKIFNLFVIVICVFIRQVKFKGELGQLSNIVSLFIKS